jgi:hypothetical protein
MRASAWFESNWVSAEIERRGGRFTHQTTLAFVVVDLPDDWDSFRKGFKRNIREAIRRSNNRLVKVESGWELVFPGSAHEMREGVDSLISLHGARAAISDKEEHGSYVGDEDAAARLVLHGNGAVFFSLSGFERQHCDLGLGTQINLRCMQDAIERGDTVANLSQNPDAKKMRWSEHIELHNEFRIVSPRRGGAAQDRAVHDPAGREGRARAPKLNGS